MGEKGSVKILFSEKDHNVNLEDVNPDVRNFLSLDSLATSLNGLSLSQTTGKDKTINDYDQNSA